MRTEAGDRIDRWMLLFAIWILHGLLAMWELVIKTGAGVRFWASPSRLTVMILFILWIIANSVLAISAYKGTSVWLKLRERLEAPRWMGVYLPVVTLSLVSSLCMLVMGPLMSGDLLGDYGAYLAVLLPAVKLVFFISLEIILLISFAALQGRAGSLSIFLRRLLIILAVLYLLAGFISITGLGIESGYKGDWSRGLPAVPLLEWQLVFATLFCLGMIILEAKGGIPSSTRWEVGICLAIWFLTAVFWTSQPIVPNTIALKPHEPNFEIYPFSDAQTYDAFAQSALVGNGFGADKIPQRPLYIVFLVFAHLLVGQEYTRVILFQALFFAFFPVLLYLVGRQFLGRPLGMAIALLAVLRDHTSNLVSNFTGNISYSKLYLSEIPTAICLILLVLVAVHWIRRGYPLFLAFLLGGVLGIGMLIRTQVIVALPVILLFALPVRRQVLSALGKSILVMLVTMTLVIVPWLWRNWEMTDEIIFDSPESQTANLALRYGRLNGGQPDITPRPGESSSDYNDRLKDMAREAISSDPGAALEGVANFFLNHAVNNILLLPLRGDIDSLDELWVPTNPFWQKWNGHPTPVQAGLIAFYIFLFGLGLAVSWRRNGLLGFLPLCLNLLYNLWTSLALLSGQRFMLAMDWSIYLYYMMGIFALLGGLLFVVDEGRTIILRWYENNKPLAIEQLAAPNWRQFLLPGLLFLGIGLSLPITERLFPEKYPLRADEEILNELTSSSAPGQAGVDANCLKSLFIQGQLNAVEGRDLYPRYYQAGDGETFTDSVGYRVVDEGRLVFDMVGQVNGRIIFPLAQAPYFFPNAADVTLISDASGQPWFLWVRQDDSEGFYISETVPPSACIIPLQN